MPGPAVHAVEDLFLEILPPKRACGGSIVCDCCRRARSAHDFGEECFGICCDCLESDTLLVELDAAIEVERSMQS